MLYFRDIFKLGEKAGLQMSEMWL